MGTKILGISEASGFAGRLDEEDIKGADNEIRVLSAMTGGKRMVKYSLSATIGTMLQVRRQAYWAKRPL
jgi:hypothetical protein